MPRSFWVSISKSDWKINKQKSCISDIVWGPKTKMKSLHMIAVLHINCFCPFQGVYLCDYQLQRKCQGDRSLIRRGSGTKQHIEMVQSLIDLQLKGTQKIPTTCSKSLWNKTIIRSIHFEHWNNGFLSCTETSPFQATALLCLS